MCMVYAQWALGRWTVRWLLLHWFCLPTVLVTFVGVVIRSIALKRCDCQVVCNQVARLLREGVKHNADCLSPLCIRRFIVRLQHRLNVLLTFVTSCYAISPVCIICGKLPGGSCSGMYVIQQSSYTVGVYQKVSRPRLWSEMVADCFGQLTDMLQSSHFLEHGLCTINGEYVHRSPWNMLLLLANVIEKRRGKFQRWAPAPLWVRTPRRYNGSDGQNGERRSLQSAAALHLYSPLDRVLGWVDDEVIMRTIMCISNMRPDDI